MKAPAESAPHRPNFEKSRLRTLASTLAILLLTACSQNYTIAVNNQPVFDPDGRLFNGQLADPDLQGCVNIAMQQQGIENAGLLNVLSCANSEVRSLEKIDELTQLRFVDLSNNRIRDLSPLLRLRGLTGVNLANNLITDISPLLNMPNIANVNLLGNEEIPCEQLDSLTEQLETNLTRPQRCRN